MLPVNFLLGQQFQQQAFHRPVKLCPPACFSRVFMSARAGAGRVCWQLLESMEWLMTDDDDQKNLRRASAQSFFQSLDELFDHIESNSSQAADPQSRSPQAKSSSQSSSPPKKARPAKINLSDFEDAIADLEQFLQNKHQKRPESNQ
jgi:hypothetical protein